MGEPNTHDIIAATQFIGYNYCQRNFPKIEPDFLPEVSLVIGGFDLEAIDGNHAWKPKIFSVGSKTHFSPFRETNFCSIGADTLADYLLEQDDGMGYKELFLISAFIRLVFALGFLKVIGLPASSSSPPLSG